LRSVNCSAIGKHECPVGTLAVHDLQLTSGLSCSKDGERKQQVLLFI
jgi:hypothetical protein